MSETIRKLAAILFTDIVDYTALMGRDEALGRQLRERHRAVVGELAPLYGGEIVDENGDELVSCFGSAVEAVNCTLRIQERLRGEPDLAVRAGIHVGDVVSEGGRLYGDGLNLAARVRTVAEPGGLCVTSEVWQAVRNQPNLESQALPAQDLKNVDRPVSLYAIHGTAAAPAAGSGQGSVAARRFGAARLIAGAVAAIALAAVAVWQLLPSTGAAAVRSIAVLPLENLSGDPGQDWFADGMTDTLIAELARVGSLRVISRTSIMAYKGTRQPLTEIAAELRVDALIEGTVTREGDRVRVTAQLIDGRSDTHLWAEQYERDLEGALALQREIAAVIAEQVRARLTPEQERRLSARPAAHPEAHDEYLKGLYFAQKHTPRASLRARDHFNAGMEIDPAYPLPYAGLADTLSCSPLHTWAVPADGAAAVPRAVMDQALELATRARELGDDLPEVEVALGLVDVFRHRDYVTAERRFDRAIELNPSYEFAHRSRALLMVYLGRFDEARASINRALDIDPFNPFVASLAGDVYAWSGHTERALELYHEASALDVGHPLGYQGAAVILCERGNVDEAEALFDKARVLSEDDPLVVGDLGHCYATSGRSEEARALLAQLRERASDAWVSPVGVGLIHLALGERDQALAELDHAFELHAYRLVEIGVDPRWDPVRDDPRFEALLRRAKLQSS